jgi:hypothetical protein
MKRREFLKLSSAAGTALFLPWLVNPAKRIVAPPRGWGLSIASQYHAHNLYGLDETLARFHPCWWHDWTWEYPGACPAFWNSSVYTGNMAAIDAAAKDWTHVLWTNEPELNQETPATVAQAISTFREHNPHVKVYGFGNVVGMFDPDTVAEKWLSAYNQLGVPVDAWHWHIYVVEPGEWGKAWDTVRAWIAAPQPQASLNEPFGTAERLPQPQPQASAEDLRAIDVIGKGDMASQAWKRIRADYERMGVGRE